MSVRPRGMTLSMLRIGLFKTPGLDEYGTAAVGWLRGAGLKATEGPAELREEGCCAHCAPRGARQQPARYKTNTGQQWETTTGQTRDVELEDRSFSSFPPGLKQRVAGETTVCCGCVPLRVPVQSHIPAVTHPPLLRRAPCEESNTSREHPVLPESMWYPETNSLIQTPGSKGFSMYRKVFPGQGPNQR
uniref:Uncharacterized protein n=1 Tax=Knipowitschia caucasica TaxID=637954 RepID=A0AAV2JF97_KNICA